MISPHLCQSAVTEDQECAAVVDFLCPEAIQVNRVSRPGSSCVKALDFGSN